MWYATKVWMLVKSFPIGQLFTTSQVLHRGPRSSIDQALSRMVKKGDIVRVCRGVFMRDPYSEFKPSISEVAKVKAKAFGKKISEHPRDAAKELKLVDRGNAEPTFLCSGASSSFMFGDVRIHFKAARQSKRQFKAKTPEKVMKALLNFSDRTFFDDLIEIAFRAIPGRSEKEAFRALLPRAPGWLRAKFYPFLTRRA